MANIKTITKKLINNGYSESKLTMMTEKEIREAYKTLKEDSSMNKTIKVKRDSHESFESWIDRINKLLSSNGIHLDNNKLLTIIDDEETDCVSIEDGLINVYGWCAGEPYYCYYDFHGNLKQYSNEGTNFELVEVEKEETTMKDNNTTVTNNSINNKEEITMTNEMTEKLSAMNRTMQLIQVLEWCDNVKNVHDAHYVKKDVLAQFLFDKDLIGHQLSKKELKKITRDELITHLRCTVNLICAVDNLKNADVITQVNTNNSNSITAGDLDITNDNAPESIEEPTPVVKNPATEYDAKALTCKLMHKIGDHAIANRKKGFGTTISAKMLCAFIVEIASLNDPEPIDRLYVPTGKKDKYGRDITMVNPKITEEHKNKCKDVRKWLLDNGYIKTVTFKDEKGFVFYTPEYDGNRKDKMYDATKFQPTGKIETTTYRVTKEMNKWYK